MEIQSTLPSLYWEPLPKISLICINKRKFGLIKHWSECLVLSHYSYIQIKIQFYFGNVKAQKWSTWKDYRICPENAKNKLPHNYEDIDFDNCKKYLLQGNPWRQDTSSCSKYAFLVWIQKYIPLLIAHFPFKGWRSKLHFCS